MTVSSMAKNYDTALGNTKNCIIILYTILEE